MASRARILVVDDDDAIRETLRFALEDAGYDVLEAADGLITLRLLRSTSERMIVLLDLMMPSLDGAGVLGTVAGDARLSAQFAYILITANTKTFPLAFATLLTNLRVPIIPKPFDIDDLLALVDQANGRLAQIEV
jgi:CheY-like chemotaxis protein